MNFAEHDVGLLFERQNAHLPIIPPKKTSIIATSSTLRHRQSQNRFRRRFENRGPHVRFFLKKQKEHVPIIPVQTFLIGHIQAQQYINKQEKIRLIKEKCENYTRGKAATLGGCTYLFLRDVHSKYVVLSWLVYLRGIVIWYSEGVWTIRECPPRSVRGHIVEESPRHPDDLPHPSPPPFSSLVGIQEQRAPHDCLYFSSNSL